MLVNLYNQKFVSRAEALEEVGIVIKRATVVDKAEILQFVEKHFESKAWLPETEYALFQNPSQCIIAVKDKELIGFACYNVAAKGFFGPTGVRDDFRGFGVGKELLIQSMLTLKSQGYGYGIIGWSGADSFYEKAVGAIKIPNSEAWESVFGNLINSGREE